jgi:hypothetical protein
MIDKAQVEFLVRSRSKRSTWRSLEGAPTTEQLAVAQACDESIAADRGKRPGEVMARASW